MTFLDKFNDESLHFIIEKIFGTNKKIFYDIIESIKPKFINDWGFSNEFIQKDENFSDEKFIVYLKEIYGSSNIKEGLMKYYEKNKPTYIETIYKDRFHPGYLVNDYFYLFYFPYESYDLKTLNREILIKALYKYALLKSQQNDTILISKNLKTLIFDSLKNTFNSSNTKIISNSHGNLLRYIHNICSLSNSMKQFENNIKNLCDNFSKLDNKYSEIIKTLFMKNILI